MITCPNKNLQEWKDLVSQVGEARAGLLWVMVDGDTSKLDEVNYDLKSVNILQSDKAKQIFEKGKKNNWDLNKILTELAIPKEQKELILDSGKTKLDDIVTDLLANFSYTVEINTAKQQVSLGYGYRDQQEVSDIEYNSITTKEEKWDDETYRKVDIDGSLYFRDINGRYYSIPHNPKIPTQHYSNLTVNEDFYENNPDWEYREMRITTPLITPSIKGHAQFAEDNDIGWFRAWYNKKTGEVHVLEIQSDLFQKGRDKKDLVSKPNKFYRVVNVDLGEETGFLPTSYTEQVEEYEGKHRVIPNKYGNFKKSKIAETSASKSIGAALMGNWSASGHPQIGNFYVYEISDTPDVDLSNEENYDFKQLQEVRYRKPVNGKLVGNIHLTPEISNLFTENYNLFSEDYGITKHYELLDEYEKKYGIRPYDKEKGSTEKVIEDFNKFQDRWYKNFTINLERKLQDIHNRYDESFKQNQFLQLLNKDSNWVTFFIKSIIQDSAKKGYEKVLFPRLDTIIQIESKGKFKTYAEAEKFYKTPEWVKKNDEAKKKLDEARALTRKSEQWLKWVSEGNTWQTEETYKDSEFEAWKKDRVSKAYEQWHSLQPSLLNTAKFYENELANRLDDIVGGNKNNRGKGIWALNQITDEYGNTWNEIVIDNKSSERILFSKKPQPRKEPNDLHSKLTAKDIYGKRYIQPIGNTGQYRILKDWKSKGLEIVKKLENEYPGVLSWKTVNNEVIISVNPQMGLKFKSEGLSLEDMGITEDEYRKYIYDNDNSIYKKYIGDKFSTSSILENIYKYKGLASTEGKLAKFLLDIQNKNKTVTVRILDKFTEKDVEGPETTEAFISYDKNRITLSRENIEKFGDARFTQTFLHEMLHSYTLYPFYMDVKKLNSKELNFRRDIESIYRTAKKYTKNPGMYGFTNEQEFISEIMTNPSFRQEIKSLKLNIWQRILKFITDYFNGNFNFDYSLEDIEDRIFKFLDTIDEVKIEKNLAREVRIRQQVDKDTKPKKEQKESAFEKEFVFFTRRVNRLERELNKYEEGTPQYNQRKTELDSIKDKLAKANEEQSEKGFLELGSHMLSRAAAFISMLETDKASVSKENLLFTINTLGTFKDFPGLETEANALFRRIYPFLSEHTLEVINNYRTEGEPITQAMVDNQDKDISPFTKGVGALSDLANYIGRTIGSLIKSAQNKASSKNKQLVKVVQENVDKLEKFAKSNGMKLEEVYEMLIDETDDDIQLVSPYINGKENPKWEVLNRPENKEVKDFYDFYRKTLQGAESNLPYKVPKNHIPNIAKTDIKYRLQNLLKVEDVLIDAFRTTEDLHADMVPDMFRAKLDKSKKSRDLGASILEFAAYSNMHNELSKALPEVRLLQEQILYKQMDNGIVVERKYVKSTDPKTKINAKESNLYKMVDTVIDMQLKGKMSKDTFTPIKTKEIKDAEGNVIGYKQVKIDNVLDLGLRYNSLLRIGLSPITAVANVSFGNMANIIEAVGGRFFGLRDLKNATNIFFSQIDYVSDKKESELYKWLESLNPLQELDDYNLSDQVRLKKMTPEKAQEMMYSLQKKGELYLQSRTMLAVLIKEGYITKNGKTEPKGKNLLLTEEELKELVKNGKLSQADVNKINAEKSKLSDKIQRLNQMIHGRYSQREAATLQQKVIYRMMIQFRKWIPSAIEARFGERQYDNRLGDVIEGRYRTFWNLVTNLNDTINRLKSGELTDLEIYNMKKNLIEITILAASILGYAWLHGGDDDEDKKRRKNPYVKTLLTLTDRVAGDLGFFYNPANYTNLAKNAMPIAKTADDLRKVVMNIPYAFYIGEWKIKQGSLKGSNKFYESGKKVLIGLKPLQDMQKLFNDNPLDEFH